MRLKFIIVVMSIEKYFILDWIDSISLKNILRHLNNFDRCFILKSNTTEKKSFTCSGKIHTICITATGEANQRTEKDPTIHEQPCRYRD